MERMLSIDEQNYHYSSSSQINIRKAVPRFLQIYAGIIPWVFLLGIIAAELAVGFWSVSIGMAFTCHTADSTAGDGCYLLVLLG